MKDANKKALELLCDFAVKLSVDDFSDHDREYLNLLFVDYFAAALAGYRLNREFNGVLESLLFDMGGKEESTVFLSGRKLPACNAAFLNAIYAGGAEMDDGHRKANGHPGSSVISAVLAMAETLPVTEKDVLTAIAVGYEFFCRLAAATQPGQGGRGFHPTGVTGTLACAAACAKLLKLDRAGFESVLAAAVMQCSGILTCENFKPISPGKAAYNGVLSAKLVQSGATADGDVLGKCTRWFRAVSDDFDMTQITEGLGEVLALSTLYIKPYPACRHLHGAIDGALALRDKVDVFSADEIVVSLYKSAYGKATGITRPKTVSEAKFSTAYTMACAFVNGRLSLEDLDVDQADPRVWELIDKFTFVLDPGLEDRAKGLRGTKVEVITNGNSLVYQEELPKGDPEFPVTREELKQKFAMCSGDLLTPDEETTLLLWAEKFGTDSLYAPLLCRPSERFSAIGFKAGEPAGCQCDLE